MLHGSSISYMHDLGLQKKVVNIVMNKCKLFHLFGSMPGTDLGLKKRGMVSHSCENSKINHIHDLLMHNLHSL